MAYQNIGTGIESRFASAVSMLMKFLVSCRNTIAARIAEEKKRDEVRRLLSLEDWELRDMGVSSDDVKSALALPMRRSAGAYLEAVRKGNLHLS